MMMGGDMTMVDMMVGMLTMTIVRNSEVFELKKLFWWFCRSQAGNSRQAQATITMERVPVNTQSGNVPSSIYRFP